MILLINICLHLMAIYTIDGSQLYQICITFIKRLDLFILHLKTYKFDISTQYVFVSELKAVLGLDNSSFLYFTTNRSNR